MKTKNRDARSIASSSNAILDVPEKTARTTHSENKRERARRRRTMRIRSRPLTRIVRMLTASRNGRRGAARAASGADDVSTSRRGDVFVDDAS